MTSSRPYLIRAVYDWIVDNDCTPQIVVNAGADHVQVPQQYVENNQIVLNISPAAVRDLQMGNEVLEFNARFAGAPFQVVVPVPAVLAVVARENGAGMSFADTDGSDEPPPEDSPEPTSRAKPALKLVK